MKDFHAKSVFNAKELASILKNGSAALFPTDTLPAIAASPESALQLWELKKRPKNKPLILMGGGSEELLKYVIPIAWDDVIGMASKYWPGSLTMVLPSNKEPFIEQLNLCNSSIGIRVPDCNLARELLNWTGPLATTSANIAGQPSSKNAEEALTYFPTLPCLGPLPWPTCSGSASTVIEWERKNSWKLLRAGSMVPSELQ